MQAVAIIVALILLEVLLSADNAIVLALIARRLPDEKLQARALTLGVAISFVLRAVGLLVASVVIKLWYLKALGAAYLLYLFAIHVVGAIRKARGGDGEAHDPGAARSATFRAVVIALALTDAAFAIDSILVAVAMSPNIWIIWAGVLLGMVAMRFVSGAFVRLLDRFPALDHTAYALVGWAGVKLMFSAGHGLGEALDRAIVSHMPEEIFWGGAVLIVAAGVAYAVRHPRRDAMPV